MRARPIAASLLLLVAATSCREIAAPPDPSAAVSLAAAAAIQEKGEGVFVQAGVFDMPCLDEPVELLIVAPYTYHVVETPTGHRIFTDLIHHGAGTGTAVGVNSGRTWAVELITGPEVIRVSAGEAYHGIGISRFVREGGPNFRIFTSYQIVQNANGVITTERLTVRCREE